MKILGAEVEKVLPYDIETVRRYLSAPALIVNWHPWVEEVSIFEQKGLIYRRSTLAGGETELVEKFWEEENGSEFHYQVVQGLWADNRYRSKISLSRCGEGCEISWQGRLMTDDADDESEQMEAFYEQGLEGLQAFLADLN